MQDVEATIISQYANSPTLVRLIYNMNAYLDPSTNIDNFYSQIWDVNTAVGYGLDVWGRIVGVSRVLTLANTDLFGFTDPSGGASGVPWNQGVFRHGTAATSNYTLGDAAYRVLILAKALKNICNATIGAINQILINLFGPDGLIPVPGNAYVADVGGDGGTNMTLAYTFVGPLPPIAQAIIYQSGVLPRPAGVSATVVVTGNAWFEDVGGVLTLLSLFGYPTSASGLPAGSVWSSSLAVHVVPGITPDPAAPPLYFGDVTAPQLQAIGGGNLPLTNPGAGSGQLWNNSNVVNVA